jgi:single-strand DNA-binding protein
MQSRLHLKANVLFLFSNRISAMEPDLAPRFWPKPPDCLPHHLLHLPHEGARVAVAGLVVLRQRPGTAKGVIFITLEDEFSTCNVIIWQKIYQQFRRAVIAARLMRVTGRLQRQAGITHIIAEQIEDISPLLDEIVLHHTAT